MVEVYMKNIDRKNPDIFVYFIEKNMGEENRSKNKMDCVYEFYNKGMKIEEIAKELNMGKGEVSLILSMYNGVFKNGNV